MIVAMPKNGCTWGGGVKGVFAVAPQRRTPGATHPGAPGLAPPPVAWQFAFSPQRGRHLPAQGRDQRERTPGLRPRRTQTPTEFHGVKHPVDRPPRAKITCPRIAFPPRHSAICYLLLKSGQVTSRRGRGCSRRRIGSLRRGGSRWCRRASGVRRRSRSRTSRGRA